MKVFNDHRGSFTVGVNYTQFFIAENIKEFTFRGLHTQTDPLQTKTVKIISGKAIDFLYNLHTGEVQEYILTPDVDPLFIGKEYAHGYLTLVPNTVMVYGVEGEFNPETYKTVSWRSVPQIQNTILNYTSEINITISDKDNI